MKSADYIQYLSVKRMVDDRALNHHVWQTLKSRIADLPEGRPVRVIELGAGIGTMVERLIEWQLAPYLEMTLIEQNPDFVAAVPRRMAEWAAGSDGRLIRGDENRLVIGHAEGQARVAALAADLYDAFAAPPDPGSWDLVIAHGVMDLVDIGRVLTGCRRLTGPGGLLYFSLNYDGLTEFWPPWGGGFETRLIERYQQSMDDRRIDGRPSGGRRSGRRLLGSILTVGLSLLAAGGSDWLVHPVNRRYPDGEDRFLESILETIWQELSGDAETDRERLAAWIEWRHDQIRSGELIFAAKNMDILAAVPAKGS